MKQRRLILLGLTLVALASQIAAASKTLTTFEHDFAYEQALRYEASADKAITPAKVIRWLTLRSGGNPGAPSSTEFVPTVDMNESKMRIMAAVAYKF